MENTAPLKRNRGQVFTSPEFENKRQCNLSLDSETSSDSIDDLHIDTPSMASHSNLSIQNVSGPDKFVSELLNALQNPDVLKAIGMAVATAIIPIIRTEIKDIMDKTRKLEDEVNLLKEKMVERDSVIDDLIDRVDRGEQHSRMNNLRIMGIQENKGEHTDQLVINLAKSLDVNISIEDIDISHRVPRYPPEPQGTARPVIVRFVNNAPHRQMIANRFK